MASLPATESPQAYTPLAKPTATTGWGLLRGALVVALMVLLVGALGWMVFGYGTDHFVDSDAKRVLEREKILADRNAEDAKLLHDPASWLAKDKGIVRVPLDQAIAMTIPDLKEAKPHAAYPVKQSPPQPANAPTSPDKGAGVAANSATNPSASNPTVGQPSPAPVAAAPTVAPVTSASKSVPSAPPLAPSAAPSPAPAATAVPASTPMGIAAPSPDNNASNPGSPPVPGASVQPAAPTAAPAPPVAAATGTSPEPLMTPPSQPTPTGTATPNASEKTTPTPAPNEPGAGPSGTP